MSCRRDIPVWGPASLALKLAKGGQLDSLTMQLRQTNGEVIDTPKIVAPEEAARNIFWQISSKMGVNGKEQEYQMNPKWFRFGYMNLGKRKTQRLLAPVYIAAVQIQGPKEAQAYIFATSATDKSYIDLFQQSSEPTTIVGRPL